MNDNSERRIWLAISACFILLALVFLTRSVSAQEPQVKYCKNLTTGEIIVVEIGLPCPAGTAKI